MDQICLRLTFGSVAQPMRQCRCYGLTPNTSSSNGPLPTRKSLNELMLPTIDMWLEVLNVRQSRCGNSIVRYQPCPLVLFCAFKRTNLSCFIGPLMNGGVRQTRDQHLRRLAFTSQTFSRLSRMGQYDLHFSGLKRT